LVGGRGFLWAVIVHCEKTGVIQPGRPAFSGERKKRSKTNWGQKGRDEPGLGLEVSS